ncbi:MAG: tripartite tricarboxylate transporter substrate binding protein [Rubrivivax sp.]|jgi:tripartite-type tricarboxylate transporter receptor subunit TctC|nr:tripartite tricarboxylate transporter substrate binding protein [Rubrivivax sp.]
MDRTLPPLLRGTSGRLSRRTLLAGTAAITALPARAQGAKFPARPVKLVLPQPPGGAADRLARLLGERLESRWKQPVVLENRPGGGVVVGTQAVARSAPDGHTIGLLGSSLSINAVQRKDLPYDLKDLQPLVRIGYYTIALVATASFAANDIAGLVALAKKQPPNALSFGSNGVGTAAHVSGELLNHMAGITVQHVPYNGAARLYTDIIGGMIPMGYSVVSSAESFIKAGQMKVLGVTSAQRSPLYAQWPTIAETLPGFEVVNWAGLCAPAGLPREVARQLEDDLMAVLKADDMPRQLAAAGIEWAPQGSAEFGTFIHSEVARFGQVLKPLAGPQN